MAHSLATFGIYPSMTALHAAAEALKAEGFRQTDISVLYSDRGTPSDRARDEDIAGFDGAGTGAHPRGFLAYLAGIGALSFPGIGPLLAGGPLASAFNGSAAARLAPGLTGALVGLGLLEDEARRYEGCLKEGGILLSVFCDDAAWARRATSVLTRTGAEHLSAAVEKEGAYQP